MDDRRSVPNIKTIPPGPESIKWHQRAAKYLKGYSSQVRQFPVVFERGEGATLSDADGNVYIDFSSGIYCHSTGHCHPKVVEKTREWVGRLMNSHDFTTPIKAMFLEKLASFLPGDLKGIQLFCGGAQAVEATMRAVRAAGRGPQVAIWHPLLTATAVRSVWSIRVTPDVLVFGKGTAGGFPLSGIAIREQYAWALERMSASTTYGGNPLACAAGLATERATREPFVEAGNFVYKKAFAKGLAWIPAGNMLRLAPPLTIDEKPATRAMDLVDEALSDAERCYGV